MFLFGSKYLIKFSVLTSNVEFPTKQKFDRGKAAQPQHRRARGKADCLRRVSDQKIMFWGKTECKNAFFSALSSLPSPKQSFSPLSWVLSAKHNSTISNFSKRMLFCHKRWESKKC